MGLAKINPIVCGHSTFLLHVQIHSTVQINFLHKQSRPYSTCKNQQEIFWNPERTLQILKFLWFLSNVTIFLLQIQIIFKSTKKSEPRSKCLANINCSVREVYAMLSWSSYCMRTAENWTAFIYSKCSSFEVAGIVA